MVVLEVFKILLGMVFIMSEFIRLIKFLKYCFKKLVLLIYFIEFLC